ncbi:cyclin N-terminal domain-containing protein [Pseudoscourfieldia marina]
MAAFTMEDEALMRAIDPTTFTTLLAKIVDVHTDGAKTNAHEPPAKRLRTSSNGQASTSYAEVVVTGVVDAKEAAERRMVEAVVRGDYVDIVEVEEKEKRSREATEKVCTYLRRCYAEGSEPPLNGLHALNVERFDNLLKYAAPALVKKDDLAHIVALARKLVPADAQVPARTVLELSALPSDFTSVVAVKKEGKSKGKQCVPTKARVDNEQKLHMQNLCPAYDDDHWGANMNASARIVQRVAAITKVLIRLPAKIAPSQEGEVALPKSNYMTSQRYINSVMRAILVDWLLEVAWDVGDYEEVIFYATNYLDRCLSSMQMTRPKLQLLGVACMLVANKYHGHQTMSADDCKSYTDNAYECKELIDMEQIVLQTLNFQLDMRTSYSYLRKYLRSLLLPSTGDLKHSEFTSDARLSNLSRYLLDLTLLDIHFLDYEPTKVAASALLVALYTLNGKCPETLLRHTGHTRVSLRECATSVHAAYVEHACAHGAVLLANYAAREIPALYKKRDAKELHALHKMYAKERLNRVSKLHPPRALSDSLFQA